MSKRLLLPHRYPQDDFSSFTLIGYYRHSTYIYLLLLYYIHDIIVQWQNVLNRNWIIHVRFSITIWIFYETFSTLASIYSYLTPHAHIEKIFYIIISKIHSPAYIEFYLLHNGYLISELNVLRFHDQHEKEMKMKIDVKNFLFREKTKERGRKKERGEEKQEQVRQKMELLHF